MRLKREGPHLRLSPRVPLGVVVPYFVAFTVFSGILALWGPTLGNVPLLVGASWGLFLAGSRGKVFPRPRTPYLPMGLSGAAGVGCALVPYLPQGTRLALLALLSTGLSWVLLPRPSGAWECFLRTVRLGL